jgi:DNA invertase Pin-like site-specific DNA recombinase
MNLLYTRVSSSGQNEERQLVNRDEFDYVLVDKCSGSIPLFARPNGSRLKKMIDEGTLNSITIHSIDRLGRNLLDVLNVWTDLTNLNIKIKCINPSFSNFTENGKPDLFSNLLMAVISIMAEFEKNMIKERQKEGITIAKTKGKYTGRQINTYESIEKFLSKPKSLKIKYYLSSGYTINEIVKILNCSFSTVNKVKKALKNVEK